MLAIKKKKKNCNSYFSQVNVRHGPFTRQNIIYLNQCCKKLYGQMLFKYAGAKEWNKLPLDIDCDGFSKRLFLDKMC